MSKEDALPSYAGRLAPAAWALVRASGSDLPAIKASAEAGCKICKGHGCTKADAPGFIILCPCTLRPLKQNRA